MRATSKTYLSWLILLVLIGCGGNGVRTEAEHICKSCKPYYVRGSWHHPQTHYEYEEEGLASWYGPGFNGKPKPYGEPFDQNAITAAHRTLPLPSVVEVTNLENGKSVIVLVDDRGPYVYAGRIIDLSIGSAKALGTYSKGIAKVRVRSLVAESQAFAKHLKQYGKSGRDPSGRTWRQILDQEILPKRGSLRIMPADPAGPSLLGETGKTAKIEPSVKTIEQKAPTITNVSTYVDIGPKFKDVDQAKKYIAKLNVGPALNKQANLVKKIVQITKNHQTWYNVRVGPFKSIEAGQAALQHIKIK